MKARPQDLDPGLDDSIDPITGEPLPPEPFSRPTGGIPMGYAPGRVPKGRRGKKEIPEWALPLLRPCRLKGIKGGRGGGKSHEVMELQIVFQVASPRRNVVFIREVQKSIKDSVYQLLKDKIESMGLSNYFELTTTEIRSTKGPGRMLFIGMNGQTAASIKSLEGMDCAVVEEAQTFSKPSIKILLPTIRREGAEVWFLWNPKNATDPVDQLFAGLKPGEGILIHVNYTQNRHASTTLKEEAARCKREDPEGYKHIYGGEHETHSDARIFKHVKVECFEVPPTAIWRFGCDWGFSVDPLVLLAGYVEGRDIYIRHEAYARGVEIEDTRAHFNQIPGATKWTITAGKDRPERIKSAQRQGFKIKACIGGNNSEIEGVEYLQNFTWHIHEDCVYTQDEVLSYKHPIDPLTDEIVPVLPKKKNHCIEGARYMVEDIRRFEEGKPKHNKKSQSHPTRSAWRKAA